MKRLILISIDPIVRSIFVRDDSTIDTIIYRMREFPWDNSLNFYLTDLFANCFSFSFFPLLACRSEDINVILPTPKNSTKSRNVTLKSILSMSWRICCKRCQMKTSKSSTATRCSASLRCSVVSCKRKVHQLNGIAFKSYRLKQWKIMQRCRHRRIRTRYARASLRIWIRRSYDRFSKYVPYFARADSRTPQ